MSFGVGWKEENNTSQRNLNRLEATFISLLSCDIPPRVGLGSSFLSAKTPTLEDIVVTHPKVSSLLLGGSRSSRSPSRGAASSVTEYRTLRTYWKIRRTDINTHKGCLYPWSHFPTILSDLSSWKTHHGYNITVATTFERFQRQPSSRSHVEPRGCRLRADLQRDELHLKTSHLILYFFHPFGLGCEDWANPWNVQAEELDSSSSKDLYLIEKFVKRKVWYKSTQEGWQVQLGSPSKRWVSNARPFLI